MDGNYNKRIIRLVLIIILALTLIIASVLLMVTQSKYVTEMGGGGIIGGNDNDLDNNVSTPFEVGSQMELFNAISSGYDYVRLKPNIGEPLIMTGNSLDLKKDLTLDLNGNEIQRSSRNGLVNVPADATFTIIDTAANGGGGLYNPTGNVLAINGGDLNVFGGKFESGPRPSEYYSKLSTQLGTITIGAVTNIKGVTGNMPILPMRERNGFRTGNIYFDRSYGNIAADTYCYVTVNGASGDTSVFDTEEAAFVYSYTLGEETATVFGFADVIDSAEQLNGYSDYPNYAAVQMTAGTLNVNVTVAGDTAQTRASSDGSFYSYFGTQHTSCVYMTGGDMEVSTSGTFQTVNPADIPAGGLAKKGEGSCVICNSLADREEFNGGRLNITQLGSATAYNGSIIAARGGVVTAHGANFTKNATVSHTDDPRSSDKDVINNSAMDAAIFIRGGTVNVSDSTFLVNKELPENASHKTTYGILARGVDGINGGITCNNTNFIVGGSNSYGIYATRGKIAVNGGKISLLSGTNCYGVYAVNMGTTGVDAVDMELDSVTINISNDNDRDPAEAAASPTFKTYVGENPTDMDSLVIGGVTYSNIMATSVGVYLNSAERNEGGNIYGEGRVTVKSSTVNSQGMGVAVNGGSLAFNGGAVINAYNASAIAVNDGQLTFADGADYNVNCELNRKGNGVTYVTGDSNQTDFDRVEEACAVWDTSGQNPAGNHQYDVYVPWQRTRDNNGLYTVNGVYENVNAIRVQGGTFNCYGNLKLNFRGLYNDYDMYTTQNGDTVYFDNLIVKSFAVSCEGGTINLEKADINVKVGGGVKVQNGTINLGKSGVNNNSLIDIHTLGRAHFNTVRDVAESATADTWKFYPNASGGPAVISRGGNINVYYGMYTAEFGNGVTATNDDASVTTAVNIHGGVFTGNLNHIDSHTYSTATGPASHYGVQVMGKATVNIYDGKFDGKNGGAFIRGQIGGNRATVYVQRGEFGNETGAQDAFNVYEMSDVYLGTLDRNALSGMSNTQKQGLIKCWANLFPLSMNAVLHGSTAYDANLYVYYGTYNVMTSVNRHMRAPGSIDTGMTKFDFFIYNYGTSVYRVRGTNKNVIRWFSSNYPAGVQYGFDNSGTEYYYNHTGSPNMLRQPWSTNADQADNY